MKKNITLIGMMGAGKTVVAENLAKRIDGYFAVDVDALIEYQTNLTIPEIFNEKGEAFFRDAETEALNKVYEKNSMVVSVGGGAFERSENREIIKNNSQVVYLQASPEVLFERLKASTNRPLLKEGFSKETVEEILNSREKNYLQADLVVNTDGKSVEDVTKELLGALND